MPSSITHDADRSPYQARARAIGSFAPLQIRFFNRHREQIFLRQDHVYILATHMNTYTHTYTRTHINTRLDCTITYPPNGRPELS